MSKHTAAHLESVVLPPSDSSSRRDFSSTNVDARREIPQHDSLADVQTFTELYHLAHLSDIFQKASMILQGDLLIAEIPGITPAEIKALQDETTNKWKQPRMLYFTVLVCSMGAVEQGWAQTGMNGANLGIPKAFGIGSNSKHDSFVLGLLNCGIYLSVCVVGAWLSDPINGRLGRRGAVFVGSLLCLVSNLGSSLSRSWIELLLFRLILGAGLGINASTVSVYMAETAPAVIRGSISVSYQMWTAFGIFLGFCANAAVYNYGDSAWRLQLAGPVVPTIPLLLLVYMCPESPAWYIKNNNRYDLAFRSLRKLRNSDLQAAKDIFSTYLQRRSQAKPGAAGKSLFRRLPELFTIPRIRRATVASYVVMLSQQLCGINIIAYYSSTIFRDAGFSDYGALLASCVFGFVNFLGAFPAVLTMDTFGRRSLLLLTLPIMALTMLGAGLSFKIPTDNPAHFILVAALIYLFCALYSPGMGPVPFTYSAEVFPLSHREIGMSFAVATASFWATMLSLTFPRILATLQPQGAFGLYAGLNILALILVFLFVPETRLKTLEELDEVFSIPTQAFIRYQVGECLPWLIRRHILREKNADLPPLVVGEEYQVLGTTDYEEGEPL
ncbi:Glucose transporter GlcP [Exophiala dermatitidis]